MYGAAYGMQITRSLREACVRRPASATKRRTASDAAGRAGRHAEEARYCSSVVLVAYSPSVVAAALNV